KQACAILSRRVKPAQSRLAFFPNFSPPCTPHLKKRRSRKVTRVRLLFVQRRNRSMQRQAILVLNLLLVTAQKATCQQDMNSDSLMDQAQNAVARRIEQLTGDYAEE